jgi:NTE family protein
VDQVSIGRTVGELDILRDEPRSASIRAKTDAVLYYMDAEAFMAFVHEWPQVAVAIAQQLANHFVRGESQVSAAVARPLWAVSLSDPLPTNFGLKLARAALPYIGAAGRRVIVLSEGSDAADLVEAGCRLQLRSLDRIGDVDGCGDTALVVLAGSPAAVAATTGRATAIVHGEGNDHPEASPRTRRIEIARHGLPTANRVRLGHSVDLTASRVARHLLGRCVGVALGGGAARGIAHLGVLQVISELDIPIDFIAGTSMGSVMGAFFAANGLEDAIRLFRKRSRPRDWLDLLDPMIFVAGMVRGKKLASAFERELRRRTFEDLDIPFGAAAFDIETGDEHMISRGRLVDAILSSISIPGIFAPYRYRPPGAARDCLFVDGGVSNNVPVSAARRMGADRVIGVHVLARRTGAETTPVPPVRPATISDWLARRLAELPTVARALTLLKSQLQAGMIISERQVLTSDVAIFVDTTGHGPSDFWHTDALVAAGRRAAVAVAEQLHAIRTS